jgi:hypothetical protein
VQEPGVECIQFGAMFTAGHRSSLTRPDGGASEIEDLSFPGRALPAIISS